MKFFRNSFLICFVLASGTLVSCNKRGSGGGGSGSGSGGGTGDLVITSPSATTILTPHSNTVYQINNQSSSPMTLNVIAPTTPSVTPPAQNMFTTDTSNCGATFPAVLSPSQTCNVTVTFNDASDSNPHPYSFNVNYTDVNNNVKTIVSGVINGKASGPTPPTGKGICNNLKCTDTMDLLDKVTDQTSLENNFQLMPYGNPGDKAKGGLDDTTNGCFKPSLTNEAEEYHKEKIIPKTHEIVIQADKFTTKISSPPYACGNPYTQFASGFLNTRSHFLFNKDSNKNNILKGGVEVTAAVPYGYALWPAIWMMPQGIEDHWPNAMEIDILEFMNKLSSDYPPEGGAVWSNTFYNSTTYPAVINDGNNGHNLLLQNVVDVTQDSNRHYAPNPQSLHNYGFTWSCQSDRSSCDLVWYLDGEMHYTMHLANSTDPKQSYLSDTTKTHIPLSTQHPEIALKSFLMGFDAGYYLILNIAIGGFVYPLQGLTWDDPLFHNATMDIRSIKRLILQ